MTATPVVTTFRWGIFAVPALLKILSPASPLAQKRTAANILASKPPRVIAVSSLGLCGTSPTVRFILTLVAGARNIEDAESADLLLRSATDKCKVVVVRPTALSEQPGTGKFCATRESGMAMAALSKQDLALFFADMITDTSLHISHGLHLYAAPSEHGSCVVS